VANDADVTFYNDLETPIPTYIPTYIANVANDAEVRGEYIPREWLRGGARNIGGKSNKSPMMRADPGGKARNYTRSYC
jgi:hypothetical protein